MAGDWIKMRGNLWDDPRVARLCDLTDHSEAPVIGALYWLWATADQHTETGIMPGLTLRQIDRKTGIQGFGQALCDIGWLADHPEGVRIVGFEQHNGTSAKRRCTEAQRKANSRSLSASDADTEQTEDGQKAPSLGAREEKRREEEKTVSKPSASHPPAGGLAAGFDEFWLAWPKGERKQDKAKCLDHWKRNGLAAIAATILADVRLKRGTRKWAEGFIEAPLVYLRGKRWDDGVEPEVGPVAGAEPLTVPSKAAEQTARELAEQDARAAALRTPEEQERARQALARARSALKVVA